MVLDKKFYKVAKKYKAGKTTREKLLSACAKAFEPGEKSFYEYYDNMVNFHNQIIESERKARQNPIDSPYHEAIIKSHNKMVHTLCETARNSFNHACYINYDLLFCTYFAFFQKEMSVSELVLILCDMTNVPRPRELKEAYAKAMEAFIENWRQCFEEKRVFWKDFDLFHEYYEDVSYL